MESRNFRNVWPVQGAGAGKMLDGPLRTAGATSTSMDEEDIKLFRRTVERVRHASRRIHQQTRRSASEQVRKIEKEKQELETHLNLLIIFTMYFRLNGHTCICMLK